MASIFVNQSMTVKGEKLLSKVMLGVELRFTRLSIGSGYMPDGKTARDMETLVQPVFDIHNPLVYRSADGNAVVGGLFSNKTIDEPFPYRELSLWALDPDDGELLFCYGNAGDSAEIIPAHDVLVEKSIDIITYIGQQTKVTVVADEGAAATAKQLQRTNSEIEFLWSAMSEKAGATLVGPERLVSELSPGSILFVVDDESLSVTLEDVIEQATLAAMGSENMLSDILTIGVVQNLNLRSDADGTDYTEQTVSQLEGDLVALCGIANGDILTWAQTQHYIIFREFVDAATARTSVFGWNVSFGGSDDGTVMTASEIRSIAAAIGNINAVLDRIIEGGEDNET